MNMKEGHGRMQQARPCSKGVQWLCIGALLGVYVDRAFKLMASLDVTSSVHYAGLPEPSSTTRQSILPKRLITVFGAESSGSTFLATTLGIASGAFPKNGTRAQMPTDRHNNTGRIFVERAVSKRARSPDGMIEIQHLSLPWGFWGAKQRNCELADRTITVEALVPEPCFRFEHRSTFPHELERKAPAGCRNEAHISGSSDNAWTCGTNNCGHDENDGFALYPKRFFVNISSHLEWYFQRGVDITAVLSVRDKSISRAGKARMHCKDVKIGLMEEEKARTLMGEALRKHGGLKSSNGNANKERVVVVSYEALMILKDSYLLDIYKRLGIDSAYMPEFNDGNERYVHRG